MKLVIAEKPSAARNFAEALGGMKGAYEGVPYSICALRGHVMGLVPPERQVAEDKRERYRTWSLDGLPWDIADLSFAKQVAPGCQDVLDKLAAGLAEADEAVIATDDDPSGEGELLAWEALEWCGWRGKTSRMCFADEAASSVRRAFEERKPIPSMEEDGDFAKARVRERWDFCSMQFTRAASCVAKGHGYRTVVRQGRLKSVMVKLVGDQLAAYNGHVRKPFYEARFKDANGNVFAQKPDDAESIRFGSRTDVDLSGLHESPIALDGRERKRTAPGKLLDLAGISAILAKQGHKPEAVLATYQKMYEAQVVSYPRTEDRKITPEQFAELLPLADRIARAVGVDPAILTCREARKSHVEEGGAHGANRPGPNVPDRLSDLATYGAEAQAIYGLLAKNFLAILAEDYEYDLVHAHVEDFPDFVGEAKVPAHAGFKAVFDADGESEEPAEGREAANASEFGETALPYVHEGSNKRPQRPTMKWLNKRLEKHNVGTGATRTSTLAEITADDERALMKEARGNLSLTRCGIVSFALLDGCQIASPEATERLFAAMEAVGRFEADPSEVLATVTGMVVHDRAAMEANGAKLAGMELGGERAVLGKCPRCGKDVMLAGERGKIARCSSVTIEKTEEGYRETGGCGFKVYASVCGKRLTDTQLASLVAGKDVILRGIKPKDASKKPYARHIKLTGEVDDRGFSRIALGEFANAKAKGPGKRAAGPARRL